MNDETNAILLRIERLLRAALRSLLADKLREIRADKDLARIYDLTGHVTRNEIAKRLGFSTGKVSGIWQSWEDAGLLEKDGKSFKKLVS